MEDVPICLFGLGAARPIGCWSIEPAMYTTLTKTTLNR